MFALEIYNIQCSITHDKPDNDVLIDKLSLDFIKHVQTYLTNLIIMHL